MRLEVFGKEVKTVYLDLEPTGEEVFLVAKHAKGNGESVLLKTTLSGFKRIRGVDPELGFPLDSEGRVELAEQKDHALQLALTEQVYNMMRLMDRYITKENKIFAIKLVRLLTTLDLKEAKEWVEKHLHL